MGREPERYLVELGLDERRYSKRSDFQRLSALIELDRIWGLFDHSGEDWGSIKSGQPVYLDASCNGYQHVSSLLRDKKLARLTNVIESKKGPLDLYTEVANEAKKLGRVTIEEKLNEIGLRKGLIEECLEVIFTRSLAKQPTIVRVYGSSDMLKCLEGRKGQGKPEFSMPR
ncbi:MAG: DNA-directed RNA polymerase, partial [Candidatus Thalassarchaeaceae archaeon]